MPKLILSAVGTSLFTNISGEDRALINKNTNTTESEVPEEVKSLINQYKAKVVDLFEENELNALKSASAELNSLLTFYENRFEENNRDTHILISTDTFLGKETSALIKEYLDQHFDSVVIFVPKTLSTRSKDDFRVGIKDLMKWCDETLKGYKEAGYEIIFNLTGGFKSLQGYLNTIGMFYADSIIYIFEQTNELITIPRLPIAIKTEVFQENAALFLQLSQTNLGIKEEFLEGIPDIMLEEYESGLHVLSDWGELSWNNVKSEVLQELFPLPGLDYLKSFEKDFQRTRRTSDKITLQETLAKVSCLLQENGCDISALKGGRGGGLLYDNYSGVHSRLGHFRVGRGPRVSCEYKNEELKLRQYGEHDYVNDNP